MATFEIISASGGSSSSVVGYPEGTKMYLALLTQSGTSAPVATVLVNTLGGTVVWSYDSSGTYNATLASAFVENKTVGFILPNPEGATFGLYRVSGNVMQVYSSGGDGTVTGVTVQILVLP